MQPSRLKQVSQSVAVLHAVTSGSGGGPYAGHKADSSVHMYRLSAVAEHAPTWHIPAMYEHPVSPPVQDSQSVYDEQTLSLQMPK